MNPQSAKEARVLFDAVSDNVKKLKNVETIICPPFCYLSSLKPSKSAKLGGQDVFWELQGAYTGEISARMLADLGCEYVIVGHSERRQYLGETDEIINLKLKMALKCDLKPILCVGEQTGQEMGEVVERQLKIGLTDIAKAQISNIIIAYEPVWAIGTGNACSSDNALSAALFIKKILTNLYGRFLAEKVPIIYGGSVEARNAADYIKESQMAGLLVGGASLDAEEFAKIGQAINNL